MRAKELDTLLGHVRHREVVRVVGEREFGKSALLQSLDVALTSQGFVVVKIAGDPLMSNVRYAALREILAPEKAGQHASPHEVRDALALQLSRYPNSVLLIDDAEFLDVASAQALAPLLQRAQFAGVFATSPLEQLSEQQRGVSTILRAVARLDLHALSFEQVGVLATQLLGHRVSPTLVSEVFALSSGVTGVAHDIITGARSTGAIRLADGRWSETRQSLWSVHLEETVERLIGGLGAGAMETLHALALAGSVPADSFVRHTPETVTELARAGLTTTFRDPLGRTRISPRPALITDYFRRRPIDVFQLTATRTLPAFAESSGTPSRDPHPSGEAAPAVPAVPAVPNYADTHDTHNAGLARYLRDEAGTALAEASRRWRLAPSAHNAADYLDVLLRSGSYVATATEVLERSPSDPADGETLLRLALHELPLADGAAGVSAHHGDTLRRSFPEYAPALEAYGVYVRFADAGLDDGVRTWLATEASDPAGLSEAVAAYVRATTGKFLDAAVFTEFPRTIPLQRSIAAQAQLLSTVRQAVVSDESDTLLDDPVDLAPGDDPYHFLVNSFVRAQLLLSFGRVTEARETLSDALSIGDLDLGSAALYAALLRWSALLHHRDGRSDIALALLEESAAYAHVRGPMPGMRPEFGDAIAAIIAGDRRGASERFLAEAQACADRSFVDAGWSMLRFAFQLHPNERALTLMDELGVHDTYRWAPQLAVFCRAALAQSPDIVQHAAALTRLTELTSAADFLDDIELSLREAGVDEPEAYALARQEVRKSFAVFREPMNQAAFRQQASPIETLTPREQEIAPLTATLSNREIAERLTLSVRTVENHIARSMKKLGLSSRVELPAAFLSLAQPPPPPLST